MSLHSPPSMYHHFHRQIHHHFHRQIHHHFLRQIHHHFHRQIHHHFRRQLCLHFHLQLHTASQKPTLPSLLECGDALSGDYNDAPLSFEVLLRYDGNLTFNASLSEFPIQSLFAAREDARYIDDDYDGTLTISNAMASRYTFTIKASHGVYGKFTVIISCSSQINSTIDASKSESPIISSTVFIELSVGMFAFGCCLCIVVLVVWCIKRQHRSSEALSAMAANRDNPHVHIEAINTDNMLKTWLEYVVQLPEYYDDFMQNDYQQMDKVLKIKDQQQLIDIGVFQQEHQDRLWSAIAELRENVRRKTLIRASSPLSILPPGAIGLHGELSGMTIVDCDDVVIIVVKEIIDEFLEDDVNSQPNDNKAVKNILNVEPESSSSSSFDNMFVVKEGEDEEEIVIQMQEVKEHPIEPLHVITTKDEKPKHSESIEEDSKDKHKLKYWEYDTDYDPQCS
eukprot:921765_1